MPKGGSKPGERRGGRKAGTPNKTTAAVKDMIIGALNEAGGMQYLVDQSEKNPKAFMALVGRVLPMDVNANLQGTIGLLPGSVDDLA